MAATSSLANLFSFFTPSKPPPSVSAPPKTLPVQLNLTSSTTPADAYTNSEWAPLVLSNEVQLSTSYPSDVMSVICPSLAYASTLFFRSAYNVQVIVEDKEPEEKLLGRFRREVMKAGVIQECKRRRFFENKQDEKKRKSREAAKRNRRRRPFSRSGPQDREETSKNNKRDEEGDNWDLPEGNLPY